MANRFDYFYTFLNELIRFDKINEIHNVTTDNTIHRNPINVRPFWLERVFSFTIESVVFGEWVSVQIKLDENDVKTK